MKRGNEHSPVHDNTKKARTSSIIPNFTHQFAHMAPSMDSGADAYASYAQKGMMLGAGAGGLGMAGVGIGLGQFAAASQQQQYQLGAYQAALGQFANPQAAYYGAGASGLAGQQVAQHLGAAYQQNPYAAVAAAVAAQQAAVSANQPGRCVYIGNIPSEVTVSALLDNVRCAGPLENVRFLPEKSCAFLYFLDGQTANLFYQDCQSKKLVVNGHELRVGWGKQTNLPTTSMVAAQSGATRNVYLGQLDDGFTEDRLRDDLSNYGTIEHIRIIREKNIAFVHFLSIQNAVKCVNHLQVDPVYQSHRVNYGKDRCAAYQSKANPSFQMGNYQNSMGFSGDSFHFGESVQGFGGQQGFMAGGLGDGSMMNSGNRSVYLGNLHPETTCEDICNIIRGGVLYQVRYLNDKHIAFLTFMDMSAATQFFTNSTYNGLVIKGRRVKIGWGKPAMIPRDVISAVQTGASRNVYVGGIDESVTEEKLRTDFSEYGEIELVNLLREKNCGFVNFTSVASAMKAVEGMRSNPDYAQWKVNYGKDRCGNPPRPPKTVDAIDTAQPPPPGTGGGSINADGLNSA